MRKFFDDEEEIDYGVAQNTADSNPHAPKIPKPTNGGISQQAHLNDYRNRMPFHYIEEGGDGYYYWQYGATMEIVFTITDEVVQTDPAPPYVVDIQVNGKSVLDRSTGVADITLGTLARESKKNYYTKTQVDAMIASMMQVVAVLQQAQMDNKNYIDKVVDRLDKFYSEFEQFRGQTDYRLTQIEEYLGEIIFHMGTPSYVANELYYAGTPSEVSEILYHGGRP